MNEKEQKSEKTQQRTEMLDKQGGETEESNETENKEGETGENEDGTSEKIESLQQGPRFDFMESFFYVSMAVLSDIFDGLWISRFFFAPATLLWLYMKGLNNVISKNAIAQGVELIPVIGFLPLSTIAAILTIWVTNNPESFNKVFGIAGKIFQKIAKKGK